MSSNLLRYLGSALLEALEAAAATTPTQADDKLVQDLREWMESKGWVDSGPQPQDGGGGGP